jgi:hypothetical protein
MIEFGPQFKAKKLSENSLSELETDEIGTRFGACIRTARWTAGSPSSMKSGNRCFCSAGMSEKDFKSFSWAGIFFILVYFLITLPLSHGESPMSEKGWPKD